jgi:lipoprotein-anchoring transpeptidase ErfK/SrfK
MRRRQHADDAAGVRRIGILLSMTGIFSLVLAGGAYAGYRYERAGGTLLLPGIRIAGVDVGGYTRSEVRVKLADMVASILDRPIDIRAGSRVWHETPRTLGAAADLDFAIDQAFSLSETLGWPARVYHRLFDRSVGASVQIPVFYDREIVARFVRDAAAAVNRPTRNAQLDFIDGRLVAQRARTGRILRVGAAVTMLAGAVQDGTGEVSLPIHEVQPGVTERKLGKTIIIRMSQNRLYLYGGTRLIRSYPVATGQFQYPTPLGHFEIINKRINPTWVNPAKDGWGADEPDFIPPGPDNPLGTRALDLNTPGIRIHGTPDDASIGHYASHGCIRMHIRDSEDLFDRVQVGIPVIIVW